MKKILVLTVFCSLILPGCLFTDWVLGRKDTRADVYARADTNKDGKVSADELALSGLDLDRDGVLTSAELDAGKQETDGKGASAIELVLALLGLLSVPGVAMAKKIYDQRSQARALIAGMEDVKALCLSRPANSGSPLSADNWEEVKGVLRAAAEKHTNPIALNTLVQSVTASLVAKARK